MEHGLSEKVLIILISFFGTFKKGKRDLVPHGTWTMDREYGKWGMDLIWRRGERLKKTLVHFFIRWVPSSPFLVREAKGQVWWTLEPWASPASSPSEDSAVVLVLVPLFPSSFFYFLFFMRSTSSLLKKPRKEMRGILSLSLSLSRSMWMWMWEVRQIFCQGPKGEVKACWKGRRQKFSPSLLEFLLTDRIPSRQNGREEALGRRNTLNGIRIRKAKKGDGRTGWGWDEGTVQVSSSTIQICSYMASSHPSMILSDWESDPPIWNGRNLKKGSVQAGFFGGQRTCLLLWYAKGPMHLAMHLGGWISEYAKEVLWWPMSIR